MRNQGFHLTFHPPISPIVGFILQKDVYTTNLLYANDQFPTKSLRKNIPFHIPFWKRKKNPDTCITIVHEKKPKLELNDILLNTKYFLKHKKLRNRHLNFPLPKVKTIPLNNSILQEEICKQDIKIHYLKDDCNITSPFKQKVKYNIRTKSNSNLTKTDHNDSSNSFSRMHNTIRLNLNYIDNNNEENEKQNFNFNIKTYFPRGGKRNIKYFKFDKIHYRNSLYNRAKKGIFELRKEIFQINDNLRRFNMEEKERKKSFYKKDFFPTQIFTKINMKNHEKD